MYLSLETASLIHHWANVALVGALVLGVVATFLVVWMGNVKEWYSQRDIAAMGERVSEANERAGKLEFQAEQLKAETEKSRATIASAQADAANANARAAEANRIAESERLARLQLEAKLAPRTLTGEQQERLISLLRPFSSTEVDVVTFGDTPEIGTISTTILTCLQKAGWKLHVGTAAGGSAVVTGVLVGVRSNADVVVANAAKTLVLALQSMGIGAGPWDFDKMLYPSIILNTNLTQNTPMKIFIGSKP